MKRKVIPLNNFTLKVPLLQTKLQMPRSLSSLVERPRVYSRLDGMVQNGLTLVTAPAGFGKTSAVAQWAGHKGLPVAWLSLDDGDNDPVRFWTYVTAALSGLKEGIGRETSPILHSSTNPPWETIISLLIDDLSQLPFDCALVLDDYHVISEPLVHETLSFLVRYAPQLLHPIIVGRTEPPLQMSRLRTVGQVAELTVRDLVFATGEVAAFYSQKNIDLTGEEAETLTHRTGGWAAGMQMAALSLLEGGDKAAVIKRFGGNNRLLAGYFMEEVFDGFAPNVREFLLQTSFLGRLSGPLCDAVTGMSDCGALLTTVARTCGFVACLDENDGWYVYHQLFAEFLQGLLQKRSSAQIPGLYGKAARWCEAEGLVAEAVDYYLQGLEYDQATSLIERLVPDMLSRGEIATLFRWLSALPCAVLNTSPGLCVAQAWAAVAADRTPEVEHWLEQADFAGREAEEKQPGMGGKNRMDVDRAVLRAYLALKRRDVPESLRWLAHAGQAREKVFTSARSRALQPLEPSLLGGPLGVFGHLKEKAQAMENRSHLKLRSLAAPAARAGYTLVANAEALYEWNQIDAAVKSLVEGMEEAQRAEETGALIPALFTLTKIHLARGDLAAALKVAAEGETKVKALGQPQWLLPLASLKTRLNLAAGDSGSLDDWLAHSRLDVYDRLSAARAYEHITLARVLLARRRGEEAVLLLDRLLVFAEKEERLPGTIEISNLLAIACDAVGRTKQGMEILRRNLSLGRENGYLRIFVDEGAPMLSLLQRLARLDGRERQKDEAVYVRSLVSLLRSSPLLRCSGFQAAPSSATVEPLTAKELSVLRLVARGMDNRSIAGELGVTLVTVKTHLSSIFGKLGVSGRREAVEQANVSGILR
ncbi:ATP-dependent transcriptional regulator [Desulfosporosinus orientis DSM 765]|uniref:ATP-dependent transcriptional regulator n=1 Tax=Desulfosporosinus orientis (strain ATCC 19365 / DSM 765 / NCIMB 8382 / VKM B-1628 / Singapore I) TaxID=768706 RepID=G7W8B0_DESOD|nr:LuxR C-terminal-related transcriptional regulator [Desulfosporosinus orientis]AET67050.1 ATP-dependent transcriptional regulator [Desulfosporosinus orientis DSM 765]